ncbi:MAG: NAD-dependent epimerase/dehydratase family protein, partial [Verrucomicrobia bacterium]|nr:NAD-dependent epimerase/dehydratase family protein [Verrucomicrobiota bacterium]
AEVVVYDNLTTGHLESLQAHRANPGFRFVQGDVLDQRSLAQAMVGVDTVFHFQANADVRGGVKRTRLDLEQNTIATWNVLDAMQHAGARCIVFASSATVYGEPGVFPTTESYASLQTSLYGASKYACEAMIQAYSEYFGIRSLAFRFVSWTGERYTHGVVYDFLRKICDNPSELEILGDGRQRKSYLDVSDGVRGIFLALDRADGLKNVFNLGHDDFLTVVEVADLVCAEAGSKVPYRFTGGVRGWLGDSPLVHLDTTRMKSLGWSPQVSIQASIRRTARYLLDNPHMLAARGR